MKVDAISRGSFIKLIFDEQKRPKSFSFVNAGLWLLQRLRVSGHLDRGLQMTACFPRISWTTFPCLHFDLSTPINHKSQFPRPTSRGTYHDVGLSFSTLLIDFLITEKTAQNKKLHKSRNDFRLEIIFNYASDIISLSWMQWKSFSEFHLILSRRQSTWNDLWNSPKVRARHEEISELFSVLAIGDWFQSSGVKHVSSLANASGCKHKVHEGQHRLELESTSILASGVKCVLLKAKHSQ